MKAMIVFISGETNIPATEADTPLHAGEDDHVWHSSRHRNRW